MPYVVLKQENSTVAGHEPGDELQEGRFSETKIAKMVESGAIKKVSAAEIKSLNEAPRLEVNEAGVVVEDDPARSVENTQGDPNTPDTEATAGEGGTEETSPPRRGRPPKEG